MLDSQRSDWIAMLVEPIPTFHEVGLWRGIDIAHAATIVTRSIRRAHMVASSTRMDS